MLLVLISANPFCERHCSVAYILIYQKYFLKGYGTVLNAAPPAEHGKPCLFLPRTWKVLRNTERSLYTSITGPPKMSKSWLIKGAAQYLGKMKEETVGEKLGPMNSVNYLPH